MPWLPFRQNQCHCSLKTLAKSGEQDFQICCLTLFDVLTYFNENQQESVVARNCTATQIAIQLIVNTFHKFVRKFFNYGLSFICIGSSNFQYYLRI